MSEERSVADNEHLAIELAQLREQLKTVGDNVQEIKSTVTALISLDKTIAELAIYSKQTQDNVRLLWEKHDELSSWQKNHEGYTSEIRKELDRAIDEAEDRCGAKVDSVDKKVDAWINKASGANWVIGIVFGVVQIMVFASVTWVFTNVTELREARVLYSQKIERFEKKLDELERKEMRNAP